MAEWFKLQTPIFTHRRGAQLLLYNESGSVTQELQGPLAEQLIEALDMTESDRIFIKGTIDKQGQFVVNKETLTRDVKF